MNCGREQEKPEKDGTTGSEERVPQPCLSETVGHSGEWIPAKMLAKTPVCTLRSSSNPQTLKMLLYAPNGKLLSQLAYQKNGSTWAPIAINALTNYLYLGSKALSYAENNVSSNASGTYFAYGSTNTNPTTGPSTFATYLGDLSGLYYADQRYYDYNWGRFLTADPSDANINPTASGSYNRYAYVNIRTSHQGKARKQHRLGHVSTRELNSGREPAMRNEYCGNIESAGDLGYPRACVTNP